MKIVDRLVELAMGRAALSNGLTSAKLVGDYEWYDENRPNLDHYDREIIRVKKRATSEQLEYAKSLTNAQI